MSGRGINSQAQDGQEVKSYFQQLWKSETTDPEKRKANSELLVAVGLFSAAIVFFRQYGEMLAPSL
ncbi:hypothetical protein E5Q_02397 [Mixia osmundae IAM 14324]|uniref:Uncharacterized protein n=1 Tax=Mixia osmundae (strain CBS 9802 / IAM 14324 / JCM 22182 / KY 12970) TaxID=764103 RepID=G7DYT0_MIXOS|nr:hypothetical protein E5Q_02397 [Mixia osmundae IAM 14324]